MMLFMGVEDARSLLVTEPVMDNVMSNTQHVMGLTDICAWCSYCPDFGLAARWFITKQRERSNEHAPEKATHSREITYLRPGLVLSAAYVHSRSFLIVMSGYRSTGGLRKPAATLDLSRSCCLFQSQKQSQSQLFVQKQRQLMVQKQSRNQTF